MCCAFESLRAHKQTLGGGKASRKGAEAGDGDEGQAPDGGSKRHREG